MRKEISLDFDIQAQPDEVTCGPTCLQALYNYYNDYVPIKQVVKEVIQLKTGGTLAVMLGNHALRRGYDAHIYTYNLNVFDPTWFQFSPLKMIDYLMKQMDFKNKRRKLIMESRGYIRFLETGGKLFNEELTIDLIKKYLKRSTPILTGLSATYLYGTPREIPQFDIYDSIKGEPAGHFVVITGYDEDNDAVYIADPMFPNPISRGQVYAVNFSRLINSILLGIVTYDANLLIIEPKSKDPK
jgi:hypothetical protein